MKEEAKEAANRPAMKIFKSSPKIEKVKLIKGGREGIEIAYNDCLSTNGVGRYQSNTTKCDVPAPKSLRNCFDMLKEYLLDTFSFHWGSETAKELLLSKTICNYVTYSKENDKFSLGGNILHRDNKTRSPLNGQMFSISGYEGEEHLREIFEKLIKEAELFLTGMKVADTKQIAVDYMVTKKGMEDAESEFEKMTKEEQDKFIKEASEMYGLTVVDNNGELVIENSEDVDGDIIKSAIKTRIQEEERDESPFKDDEAPSFDDAEVVSTDVRTTSQKLADEMVSMANEEEKAFSDDEPDFEIPVL